MRFGKLDHMLREALREIREQREKGRFDVVTLVTTLDIRVLTERLEALGATPSELMSIQVIPREP